MASEVQICNEALAVLGVPAILTLTDNSKAARQCNLIYANKRDELLRNFEWTFAIRRTNLSPIVTTPAFEWDYAFNRPSDSLKLLYVGDSSGQGRYPFSFEMNKILCNYNLIYIKYIMRVVDPNEMDVLFRNTLSAYLSYHLATPLGMKSEYNKAVEDYESKLSEARFNGSIEVDDETVEAEDWLNSRI